MRYCPYCQRINPGKPLYCQYCAKTFEARICSKCRSVNSKAALACGKCGSFELSDIAGEIPFWAILLKVLFWLFLVLLAIGFVRNLVSFVPLLVVVCLLLLGYSFLPEEVKNIIKFILSFIKQKVLGIKKES
ncbi:MAG: zinc ribbon domain-containing protein [Candidatus Omnitrophota bacterium]|jgi:ribosomal protein L40E